MHHEGLQCLAFGTLSKLVSASHYNVIVEVCFLDRSQFFTMKLAPNQHSHQPHVHPTRDLSISFPWENLFNDISIIMNVRILCSIASTRGTMMVPRVAVACCVAHLGFFKPKFPWL